MVLAQGCRDRNAFGFELYVMYIHVHFWVYHTTVRSGLRKREVVAGFYTAVAVTTLNSLLSPPTCRYVCWVG